MLRSAVMKRFAQTQRDGIYVPPVAITGRCQYCSHRSCLTPGTLHRLRTINWDLRWEYTMIGWPNISITVTATFHLLPLLEIIAHIAQCT